MLAMTLWRNSSILVLHLVYRLLVSCKLLTWLRQHAIYGCVFQGADEYLYIIFSIYCKAITLLLHSTFRICATNRVNPCSSTTNSTVLLRSSACQQQLDF